MQFPEDKMKGKGILFFIGIGLIIGKVKDFINISSWWIVLVFFVWFLLTFISIHKKNKERNTPKPVYLVGN